MTAEASTPPRWGFIGAGKMATALIRGMSRAGTAEPRSVRASDPVESTRRALASETGVSVTDSNLAVVQNSDVVVLAVKPQSMPQVLEQVRAAVTPEHLVISIAAGVSVATLSAGLGGERRIARVMPNTPALVGEGASARSRG